MQQFKYYISGFWSNIQTSLFPHLEENLGELNNTLKQLVSILALIRIEDFIPSEKIMGCPVKSRKILARAFIAKAVYNLPTTACLIDLLKDCPNLRRICGWEYVEDIPSESTFSRAFAQIAKTDLLSKVLEEITKFYRESVSQEHISRDSSEIEAREKPQKKEKPQESPEKPKRKRGRPKKGEIVTKTPTNLEKQSTQSLDEIISELSKNCNVGSKKNSKGFKETWIGYKLHTDVTDDQIPISWILTSASVHDSQVSIPLSIMSSSSLEYDKELMDSAYDASVIKKFSNDLEHHTIIDSNPRRGEKIPFSSEEKEEYKNRTSVERFFGRLKDEFGARQIRVRGNEKILAHLLFGMIALTADQLLRLAI